MHPGEVQQRFDGTAPRPGRYWKSENEVDPALIDHFDLRGGYLKPAEGDAKLPAVMQLVQDDVARVRMGAV